MVQPSHGNEHAGTLGVGDKFLGKSLEPGVSARD